MKKAFHIPKRKLYGEIDYSAVLSYNALGGISFERRNLDETPVETGKVCFFDPYNISGVKPYMYTLPAGKARPFVLTVRSDFGERIAFAGLDCGNLHKAAVWKLAVCEEKDVLRLLPKGGTAGVYTGSGYGSVCDFATFGRFSRLVKESSGEFYPLDGFVARDGNFAEVCRMKDVELPVFCTGHGEGEYSAYIGLDENGEALGIICDFSLVKVPEKKSDKETVAFIFDVKAEDLYVPDPNKSEEENDIARYSAVIKDFADETDTLFGAYSKRGFAYHLAGKYEEALCDYLQAINLGSEDEAATDFRIHAWSLYENAAAIYRRFGKSENAVRLYEEALSVGLSVSGPYIGLIEIYSENKDYVKALEAANMMVAARPDDPSAYLMRSEVYTAREDYEEAVADMDVLIERYKLGETILDKATCLSLLSRHEEALAAVDSYLMDNRANEYYYEVRARIELKAGDFAAAYIDMRKAYDVNHGSKTALEMLAEADRKLFNFKNVIKWSSRYVYDYPESEYGYSVRADAYMRVGEYGEALKDYVILSARTGNERYMGLALKAAVYAGERGSAKKYLRALRKKGGAYWLYGLGVSAANSHKLGMASRLFATAFTMKEEDDILIALLENYIASGELEKAEAAIPTLAEIADAEDVFVMHCRIIALRGGDVSKMKKDYVKNFLCGLGDAGLLASVDNFFALLGK